jgi:arabinan endo-1,5-alpha-L-arabinosidase
MRRAGPHGRRQRTVRAAGIATVLLAVLAPGVAQSTPTADADSRMTSAGETERAGSGSLAVFGPDTVPVGKGKKAGYVTFGASVDRKKNGKCDNGSKKERCWVPYVKHRRGAHLAKRRKIAGDALPRPGKWVEKEEFGKKEKKQPKIWSPSVVRHKGRFYMFYTATKRGTIGGDDDRGRKCIGVAVRKKKQKKGTYSFKAYDRPLVCHKGGWAIDAEAFVRQSDNSVYLVYRDDKKAATGDQTGIVGVRVHDGMRKHSKPTKLLTSKDVTWEKSSKKKSHIIENPAMVRVKGTWWLFYSGNRWQTPEYATGIAKCGNTPLPSRGCKPYKTKDRPHFGYKGPGGLHKPHKPLAGLPGNEIAPGAMDVFRAHRGNGLRVVWNYKVKLDGSERRSRLGRLTFEKGKWRVPKVRHSDNT